MARREGLEIRYYSIIYDLIDDIKALLTGMLAPEIKEEFIGYASIREVFNITKVGKVAGCMVTDGIIKRGCKVRLLRDDVVVHERSEEHTSELQSLMRISYAVFCLKKKINTTVN